MPGMCWGVAIHPDGKWIAAGSRTLVEAKQNPSIRYQKGEVTLWNLETGETKSFVKNV